MSECETGERERESDSAHCESGSMRELYDTNEMKITFVGGNRLASRREIKHI